MDIRKYLEMGVSLPLGISGENGIESYEFGYGDWASSYGDGVLSINHQRPGDSTPYPVGLTVSGHIAHWDVTAADVQYSGHGRIQVVYAVNGIMKKSIMGTTVIEPSLGENVGADPAIQSYIDTMVEIKDEAYQSMVTAVNAKDVAVQKAQDVLGLTAEASINNTVGIPSVGVSVTQDGDHKKMSFAFENLKGEPGRDYSEVFVTPEMFGAKGDGTTDDTEAVREALTHKIVIGTGVYAVSEPIYAQIDRDAQIQIELKALQTMDYLLWLDAKGSAWNQLVRGNIDVKLDCNLKAADGLRIDRFHQATIAVVARNFTKNGITIRYTNNLACGGNIITAFADNLETASTVNDTATGLRSGQDDTYVVVSCANVKTAVNLAYGGNRFDTIHSWASTAAWFDGSVLLELNTDNLNDIGELICDTTETIFKLDNTNTRHPKLNVEEFQAYNNTAVVNLPIYVWWLATTNLFYPTFKGLAINSNNIRNNIAWSAGTVPSVLLGDSRTVTDIKDTVPLCGFASVIEFVGLNVSSDNIDYLFNCKDCYYNWTGGQGSNLNAVAHDNFTQRLDSYRSSAHRARPNNMNGWLHPWVDNTFNERFTVRTVNFQTGTTQYEIVRISNIAGLLGTSIAVIGGTFMSVTSQPKIWCSGDKAYVTVTEDWIAENGGNKTFYGRVVTNGTIA